MRAKDIAGVVSVAVAALLFTSCIATGYIPQHAQVPLLEQRGEVQVSAGMSTGGMLDATLSAGLTDHLATQMHISGQPLQLQPGTYSMAVGYYRHVGPLVAEAWLGIEQGSVYNRSHWSMIVEWTRWTTGEYNLPFVQVDCGLRDLTPLHIDCGMALRAGIMKPGLRTTTWNEEMSAQYTSIYAAGTALLEPQLFVRMGMRHMKYNLQMGWVLPFSSSVEDFPRKTFSLSMGATIMIDYK